MTIVPQTNGTPGAMPGNGSKRTTKPFAIEARGARVSLVDCPRESLASLVLPKNCRPAIACSGGLDSVLLLVLLAERARAEDWPLLVIHVQHGLRGGESDDDERLVRDLSLTHGLPVIVARVSLDRRERGSLEERARQARYDALKRIAHEQALSHLFLAHHADDQAESILMRIRRGAGITGLRGMPATRPLTPECWILRPLLATSRASLKAEAMTRGLSWREDRTNLDLHYERNRVRHLILPALERATTGVRPRILRLGALAEAVWNDLEKMARPLRDSAVALRIRGLLALRRRPLMSVPAPLTFQVLQPLFEGLSHGERTELSKQSFETLRGFFEEGSMPSPVKIAGGLDVQAEESRVWIARAPPLVRPEPLEIPGIADWPLLGGTLDAAAFEGEDKVALELTRVRTRPSAALFDLDALEGPLRIRTRRPGDRYRPLGAPGRRLVSDLLQARRIPRLVRDRLPVIVDTRGILWVLGLVPAERGRVTSSTGSAVLVSWSGPWP